MRTLSIPLGKKEVVGSRLDKLSKRANRLGLENFSYSFGKAYPASRERMDQNNRVYVEKYTAIEVFLDGIEEVKFNGWTFVASLEHLPEGNLVRKANADDTIDLSKYHDVVSDCEHCNVHRQRNNTYVLQHDSGVFKQVGSTCIKDFLGGNSPDNILSIANIVSEVFSLFTEEGLFDSAAGNSFYIKDVLLVTNYTIDKFGWVPRSKEDDLNLATASRVLDFFHAGNANLIMREMATKAMESNAEDALEWAENLTDEECRKSDYLNNIRVIARCAYVSSRMIGIACSIPAAYSKAIAQKEEASLSNHLGKIGDKFVVEVTMKKHIAWENAYGVTHFYSFLDDSGNAFVWKASRRQDFEENGKYKIRGTVKAHNIYKDVKQTELTRCKVL